MTALLVIGAIGLAVLAVSFVLGDLLDGLFDALTGDFFSAAMLGGFTAAFGFGGAIARSVALPMSLSLLIGAGAGVLAALFTWRFTRLVKDGASDATLETTDALGRSGQVITAIPGDGFGTVRLHIGGHTVQLNARAELPLDPGTQIHVTQILSPTSVLVAPDWSTGQHTPLER